jgi:hypothetical protein
MYISSDRLIANYTDSQDTSLPTWKHVSVTLLVPSRHTIADTLSYYNKCCSLVTIREVSYYWSRRYVRAGLTPSRSWFQSQGSSITEQLLQLVRETLPVP